MSQPFSSTQPFTEPCSGKAFCSALHYSKRAFNCQVASEKQMAMLQLEKMPSLGIHPKNDIFLSSIKFDFRQ